MGGTRGVSIGRTDGGTIGQIVGEHTGRKSMALEQTASARPFTQVHVQAAKAAGDWRTKRTSRAAVDKMRMANTPPVERSSVCVGPMEQVNGTSTSVLPRLPSGPETDGNPHWNLLQYFRDLT
jgi:hypothetical protein